MMKPSYFEAVHQLVGGQLSGPDQGPVSDYKFVDGQTPPTEEVIQAKLTELTSAYDALDYSRKRADEYPDWSKQLEKIYDDGIEKWKSEMVDPVKAKYQKP